MCWDCTSRNKAKLMLLIPQLSFSDPYLTPYRCQTANMATQTRHHSREPASFYLYSWSLGWKVWRCTYVTEEMRDLCSCLPWESQAKQTSVALAWLVIVSLIHCCHSTVSLSERCALFGLHTQPIMPTHNISHDLKVTSLRASIYILILSWTNNGTLAPGRISLWKHDLCRSNVILVSPFVILTNV